MFLYFVDLQPQKRDMAMISFSMVAPDAPFKPGLSNMTKWPCLSPYKPKIKTRIKQTMIKCQSIHFWKEMFIELIAQLELDNFLQICSTCPTHDNDSSKTSYPQSVSLAQPQLASQTEIQLTQPNSSPTKNPTEAKATPAFIICVCVCLCDKDSVPIQFNPSQY